MRILNPELQLKTKPNLERNQIKIFNLRLTIILGNEEQPLKGLRRRIEDGL